jgi:hypothetical protein
MSPVAKFFNRPFPRFEDATRVAFPVRDFFQILERFSELLIAENAHALLHLRFSCKNNAQL